MVLLLAACAVARTAAAQSLPAMPTTAQVTASVPVRAQVSNLTPTQAVAPMPSPAQAQAQVLVQTETQCGTQGYRVVARRWDALLARNLELRQDCVHPEWPTRLVALESTISESTSRGEANMGSTNMVSMAVVSPIRSNAVVQIAAPLLVHAGDRVRLWSQDERVRIEISGVVEQSARNGDHVMVQVTRRNEDTGISVDRISGIVRAAGDVEMQP
jgi:hypothetical protein